MNFHLSPQIEQYILLLLCVYELNSQNGRMKVWVLLFLWLQLIVAQLSGTLSQSRIYPKNSGNCFFFFDVVLHFVRCFICSALIKFDFGRNQGIPGRRNIPRVHSWKWPPESAGVWVVLHLCASVFRNLQQRAYLPQSRGSCGKWSCF